MKNNIFRYERIDAPKRITIERLNRYSKKYDIWCIGCGKRLYEMLEVYQDEPFILRITHFIDNNKTLWGQKISVGNKYFDIENREMLNEDNEKKRLLLITSDAVFSIYQSIKRKICANKDMCYVYPCFYRNTTPVLLKLLSGFINNRRLLFYAGTEPHENADAIVEYLYQEYHGKKFKLVYLGESSEKTKNNVVQIDKSSVRKKASIKEMLRYCYYYATSKYLFYENEALNKVCNRQVLIYLNHGTIPLKQVSDVLKQPEELSYGVCPSEGCADIYTEQYGIPKAKLLYMMPARVNYLFGDNAAVPWKQPGEKLILWLPTFRQLTGSIRRDSVEENPLELIRTDREWLMLDGLLNNTKQRLVIKKHPREKIEFSILSYCTNINIITENDLKNSGLLLHQVLAQTDALITDYSGIAFEFMLLNRPIGYVVSDMQKYIRGFAVKNPLDFMPGPKIHNLNEMFMYIKDVAESIDQYKTERAELVKKLFQEKAYKNGAKELIERIEGKI